MGPNSWYNDEEIFVSRILVEGQKKSKKKNMRKPIQFGWWDHSLNFEIGPSIHYPYLQVYDGCVSTF